MKAKEFIVNEGVHPWHIAGIPGLKSLIGLDQYYDIYRFGLAMAAAGQEEYPYLGDAHGVTEDNPTTLSYTDEEEKIINDACKRIGQASTQITPRRSSEPKDTYKQSPVQPKGPIKRKT